MSRGVIFLSMILLVLHQGMTGEPKLKCPEEPEAGFCVEACSSDVDCSPDGLCCFNGCGHTCAEGVPDEESCDLECEEGFKCANYVPICSTGELCDFLQTCVPEDYLGCSVLDCVGCCLQEVTCVMAPCYPVPTCGLCP